MQPGDALDGLRDLSDFCQYWPELKKLVADERLAGIDLHAGADTYRTIKWMRALADRVCPGERF